MDIKADFELAPEDGDIIPAEINKIYITPYASENLYKIL